MALGGKAVGVIAVVFLAACAQTPFHDVAVEKLSDQQLVDELAAASAGVGRQINKAEFLLATTPDSLYVLSSSTTTYFGTNNVVASGYVVPTRYGAYFSASGAGTYSGTAQTRYYYTDVNATAQVIHALGAAIAQASAEAYRRRGLAVLAEMRGRIEAKRVAAQQPVDRFFAQNQSLAQDKALITAVLAWVPADPSALPGDDLKRAKAVVESMKRGPGAGGEWYGVFTSISKLPDGRRFALNNFVRLSLIQDGEKITGVGELGTREQLQIDCRIDGDKIRGTVTNPGAGIVVTVSGTKTERDKVTLEFSGGRSQLEQSGTVALFR